MESFGYLEVLIDADLATNGIDEFLAFMLPRQLKVRPDHWTGQSLHLHRTDGEGEWTIRLGLGANLSAAPQRMGLPKRITFPSGSVMEPSRLP
jgi:hypothetical protein